MKISLALLSAIAVLILGCSKPESEGSGNPPPPPTVPPPPPPTVLDNGLDTLGSWVWHTPRNLEFKGEQLEFLNEDTGYMVATRFFPSAGLQVTYDKGKTWLPGNGNFFVPDFTAWSRLSMKTAREGAIYAPFREGYIRAQYQPYWLSMDFNSNTPYRGVNLVAHQYTGFLEDVHFKDTIRALLHHPRTIDVIGEKTSNRYVFEQDVKPHTVGFCTTRKGFVGGEKGQLLKTLDGGKTWSQALSEDAKISFVDITFADEQNGWIMTNTNMIYCTTDGGSNWQQHTFPGKETYHALHAPQTAYVMVTRDRGFVAVDKYIYETGDGGKTWSRSSRLGKTGITAFSFDKKKTVWALSGEGLLKLLL